MKDSRQKQIQAKIQYYQNKQLSPEVVEIQKVYGDGIDFGKEIERARIRAMLRSEEAVEIACESSHDAYEAAAVRNGWETNPKSRKPWRDVPKENADTVREAMRAALSAIEDLIGE